MQYSNPVRLLAILFAGIAFVVPSLGQESYSDKLKSAETEILKQFESAPADPSSLAALRQELGEEAWGKWVKEFDIRHRKVAWDGKNRLAHALNALSDAESKKTQPRAYAFLLDKPEENARVYFESDIDVLALDYRGGELVATTVDGESHLTHDVTQLAPYIVSAYEDKDGNLWFGSVTRGAIRYDGKSLTYFTEKDGLPSGGVVGFAEDHDGNLWLGTQAGFARFDGNEIKQMGREVGLPTSGGSFFVDRDGDLWANTYSGVYRYDGNHFSEFELPIEKKKITSYSIFAGRPSLELEDSQGNLWFATDGYGAFRFDGTSFTHFTKEDGLCSNTVTNILEDRDGNIWFSCIQSFQPEMTGDGGVCRLRGKEITKFPQVEGLAENDVYTIYSDTAGRIWIGATGKGVYRYEDREFTLFEETDRMDLTWGLGLQAALEDKNGNFWMGFSGGLFRFDGKSIVNVTKEDLGGVASSPDE